MKKKEQFCGRVVFIEAQGPRRALLFDERLRLVREFEEVPQKPEATEHELRVFVNSVAPPGARVQRNKNLGFMFDFLK